GAVNGKKPWLKVERNLQVLGPALELEQPIRLPLRRALGERQSTRDGKYLAEIDRLHRDRRAVPGRDREKALVPEVHERRDRGEVIVDDFAHAVFPLVASPFDMLRARLRCSELELRRELLRYGDVLQAHVAWQPVLERGKRLTPDQGRQIPARLGGDTEAVARDEVARHALLDVGDLSERRHADLP